VAEAKAAMVLPAKKMARIAPRLRCRAGCCGRALWHRRMQADKEVEVLVPLQEVAVNARIETGLVKMDLMLVYANTDTEGPIEVQFEYPLLKRQVVSKLVATIDDRHVSAKIKDKEEAKEKYDEAIASGKAAVYAERDTKKTESLTLNLGNLLPGQTAQINIQIIEEAELVGGSYTFRLPNSLFPQYKKHKLVDGVDETDPTQYLFSY